MISEKTVEQIQEAAHIEEVVGDFVNLKKRGVNFIGLCPFHNEKTPSFTVSPAKGIYKCFGCGAAGNSVKFVMEHEHYSFPEALRYLADKYRIEIEETGTPEDQKAAEETRSLKESIFIANNYAQRYFSELLFDNEEGRSVGLSYFKERGFTEEIIKKFQLGYALDEYDAFTQSALKNGYQLEVLEQAGLAKTKEGRSFDFFRGRVQFAIHNFTGKVIGFGGRILKKDVNAPKYINTPESEVYHKSKVLYGIFQAKNAIRKLDNCLLVEGYTDVISLVQAGVENVAASSGTALTVEQVRLIHRLTPNVTILYDGDDAGRKAAIRGVDIALEEDLNVKVVLLPDGEDPDSYIRKVGAHDFQDYIQDKAKDFILFKTGQLAEDAQRDPVKKTQAIRDIVASIALVPDVIKRTLYTRECSELMKVDERILLTEINKIRRKKFSKETQISREEAELIVPDDAIIDHREQHAIGNRLKSRLEAQEADIIRLLLEHGDEEIQEGAKVVHLILHELKDVAIENPACNAVFDAFKKAAEAGEDLPDVKFFTNHEDPALGELVIRLIHSPYMISENWEKMHEITITDKKFLFKKDIKFSLGLFKVRKLQQMRDEASRELQRMETSGEKDDAKEREILQRIIHIQQNIQQLGRELGVTEH